MMCIISIFDAIKIICIDYPLVSKNKRGLKKKKNNAKRISTIAVALTFYIGFTFPSFGVFKYCYCFRVCFFSAQHPTFNF